MRKLVSFCLAAALVLTVAGTTLAAKGGNGGGNGGGGTVTATTSTIALNQAGLPLTLGSSVTFTTTVVGLKGGEYPMVYVACFSPATGAILYGQLDHPDATFILGGGSSAWWLVGGPANCLAHLYSSGGTTQGGYDQILELATPVAFAAG